jgi:hypothetical protein
MGMDPDAGWNAEPDSSVMGRGNPLPTRYAASFCSGFSAPAAGALVLEEDRLRLEGRSLQGQLELNIPYSELSEVRIGRLPEELVNGNAALLLSRRDGELFRVKPIGFGLLHELADLLASLANEHAEGNEQVAVVLPLRAGRLWRARELVAQGPPFDPAVLRLRKHEVYLTEAEAIFVFEGRNVRRMIERLTHDPTLWQAGLAWRSCIGGRPRLITETRHLVDAQPAYSWAALEAEI